MVDRLSARRIGWGRAMLGSACLWAWGFLAYLSPVLIPADRPAGGVGIEIGFFVSQGTVVVAVLVIVLLLRRRSVAVGRGMLLGCALSLVAASSLLSLAVANNALWLLVGCGVVCGAAGTLLGCAWGARYSLESKDVSAVVMVSFLVAYAIYFAVMLLFSVASLEGFARIAVIVLPAASWALWFWDASSRSDFSPEVFPASARVGSSDAKSARGRVPGEVAAGSRELHAFPWGSLGVIAVAALVGNVMSSVIMGTSYDGADSLYPGGIVLCACIATMALVPLTAERVAFSVPQMYRITITFSVAGLVAILVFGSVAVPVGGALVQGCTLFFQPLVYVVVTCSTRFQGLSPLVSFGVGQALISAVALVGNLVGKLLFSMAGTAPLLLSAVCGGGVLALFFMMVARAARMEEEVDESEEVILSEIAAVDGNSETLEEDPATVFARAVGLTARETEILGLLVRGRTLPYIANELFVTTGTVKTHVRHIYEKALVSNRQELLDKVESSSGNYAVATFLGRPTARGLLK